MFIKSNPEGYLNALPGVKRKTLAYGGKTLMSEFRLEEGSDLPLHSHIHEQTGYLVSGKIILSFGGNNYETFPGDSWCIASGVEHSARALEDSVAIEVFSPLREDYLP